MLKCLFSLLSLIVFLKLKKSWSLVQFFFFFVCFLYLLNLSTQFYFVNLNFFMGQDLLSYGLILLSFWISALMILSSFSLYYHNFYFNKFLFIIIILMVLLYLTFSSLNFFMFYLYFESSLIPILLLILGWGYQPERIQAGIYMLFYTLLASMPLLLSLFFLYFEMGTLYFLVDDLLVNGSVLLYLSLILAFLVKLPMFLFHLWLPKAHVEAPVSGSMILAGVLLKLGGYGLIRVLSIVMNFCLKLNLVFVLVSLIGGVLISLVCIRQEDMKSLIAYSSVSHMGIMLGGMMTMSKWGFNSSYMMMVGHGLCSSGLFVLTNFIYERLGTRSMVISKGMLHIMPSMSMWWFLFCINNMGSPPSMNLVGEIGLINSLFSYSYYGMFMVMFCSFLSAGYSLYLFSRSQHGSLMNGIFSFVLISVREYMIMILHWLPLNLMIVNCEIFFYWL
uniref:NADH-ubiquinone oxidoreductase chain 4 n=1 Tax=Stimulopalpus japonicus TaxID=209965 RepID=A0A343QCJ5_9NEOP|nr:NADH dehydrogenase subunit 4 [Stimulopalpus japonicus]ATU07142.1 NADH dehydrogenase subunit 4 [Stimulopalpus japonicus]